MENQANSSSDRSTSTGQCVVTVNPIDNTVRTELDHSTEKQQAGPKRSCITLPRIVLAIIAVLVAALVVYVIYNEVRGRDEKPTEVVNEQSQTRKLTATEPPKSDREFIHEGTRLGTTESYRLSQNGSQWRPGPSLHANALPFTRPVHNQLCIKVTIAGEYEIHSKITLDYEHRESVYHALRHIRSDKSIIPSRFLKDYIVEKNNFRFHPAQSGRMPSSLQTAESVGAGFGDLFCIQVYQRTDIYISWADNHFSFKKVG